MNAATKVEGVALTLEMEPADTARSVPVVQQTGAVALAENSPAAIMMAAVKQGIPLDQVEKMMDLQERYERREAEKQFRADFAAFRGENIIVPKTKRVDRGQAGSFDQAEFHVVAAMLSPALARHGFGFRHDQKFGAKRWMVDGVESDAPWVYVTCHLEHRAGHSERLDLEGPPGELKANTPTQNMQVTASYLKRQALLALTGTATGGEDDENAMRGQRGNASAEDTKQESMLDAGQDAALGGMKSLLAWWGSLNSRDRASLQKDYPALRKAAERADRENSNA